MPRPTSRPSATAPRCSNPGLPMPKGGPSSGAPPPGALGYGTVVLEPVFPQAEGLPLELVGQHLRLSGTVNIGFHNRLTDFMNNNDGLVPLRDVNGLRRNGDPTKVTSPSIWINPDEVTLIAETSDVEAPTSAGPEYNEKKEFYLIVVTPGPTLT